MPSPALSPAALVPGAPPPSSPGGAPSPEAGPGAFARELQQASDQAAGSDAAAAQPPANAAGTAAAGPLAASRAKPLPPTLPTARGASRGAGLALVEPGAAPAEPAADADLTHLEAAAGDTRPDRRPPAGRIGRNVPWTRPDPSGIDLRALQRGAAADRLPDGDPPPDGTRPGAPDADLPAADPSTPPALRPDAAAAPDTPAPNGPTDRSNLPATAPLAPRGTDEGERASADGALGVIPGSATPPRQPGTRLEHAANAALDDDPAARAGPHPTGDDRSAPAAPTDERPTATEPLARRDEPGPAFRIGTTAAPPPLQAGEGARAAPAPASAPAHLTAAAPMDLSLPTAVASPAFVPRLSSELAVLARDGVQQARVQVNPAELGPITVQITIEGTGAQVHLAVDSALTRDLLEKGMPALAAALRETGLTLTGGGVFQQPRQNPRDPTAPAFPGPAGRLDRSVDDAAPSAPVQRPLQRVGALDLYA